ncbi:MAG: tetratricopeptide repeat protein [Leptospirillia bacterium]
MNVTTASEQAKRFIQRSQFDRAIEVWEEVLEDANDNDAAGALNNIGDLHARKKNTVEAIDHFLKASHAFEKAGFPLKAIATLKKALKLDPSRPEIYLRQGDLNARREMVGNAVESYLMVARLLVAKGEKDEAMEMVQKVRILDPVNTRHRLQVAAELFELGLNDQAVAETINAIDLFLQNDNLEDAERYCRHLLDLNPNIEEAKERLELIAHGGQQAVAGGEAGGDEASIDDIFAELDGPADSEEPAEAPLSMTSESNAPLPPGGDMELGELIESTSQTGDAAMEGLGTDDPFAAALEGNAVDGDDISAAMAGSASDGGKNPLEERATDHLNAGEMSDAYDCIEQLVTESLAQNQPQAAEAATLALVTADPDNPAAHELRLRVHEGRSPVVEAEVLAKLVEIHGLLDPARAEEFQARLDTLKEGGNGPADSFSESDIPDGLDLSGIGLAAVQEDTDDAQATESPIMDVSTSQADDDDALSELDLSSDPTAMIDLTDSEPSGEHTLDLDGDPDEDDGMLSIALDDQAGDTDDETVEHVGMDTSEISLDLEADDVTPEMGLDLDAPQDDSPATEEIDIEGTSIALDTDDEDLFGITAQLSAEPAEDEVSVAEDVASKAADSAPDVKPFNLDEALAEAAFYGAQGMTDEAVRMYHDILAIEPDHPEATERLNAIDSAMAEAPAEPPAATRTAPSEPAPPVSSAPSASGDGEFENLASEIQDTLENEVGNAWREVGEDAKMDEILTAFRAGIEQQVSEDDAETHYDLGVAYREMGLIEEAIGEFQIAIKGAQRFADTCIMMAQCFAESDKHHLGISQLKRGIEQEGCTDAEWMALTYELATQLEAAGQIEEAKQRYEEIYARDITYREVSERVARLN